MNLVSRSVVLSALMVGTCWLCKTSPEIRGGGEAGVIMQLPEKVGPYNSRKREVDPVEAKNLPSDTGFAKATYFTEATSPRNRDVINFEIVLSGAERRSIHRPEVCLVGQGWTIMNSSTRRTAMGAGRELRVRDLYIQRAQTLPDGKTKPLRAHYYYWFVGTDVTTPSHAERIWLTLWDNLARGVNHRWAYVTMLALVSDNFMPDELGERCRTDVQTTTMLDDFVRLIAPRFQKSFMDNRPVAAAN